MKFQALRACAQSASLLAILFATAAAPAQQPTPLQDPANLAGERVSAPDLADTLPIDHGTPALQQLLRKLRTRASFMLIVAHPDDEDGGMLTYLSRGQGARVAMLTLNRGEGGQNLMSGDFEDALGLIRTQELLAADRYMAVDQFFGTEVDFGFSKTKEESFTKWTHDRVLYDAVRAVRLYRPLVIASVFIGAPSDGHGQHQVSGQIAQEVFNAAGDPKVFPDQIASGLQPWQPLKVYARVPFARIDAQGMYDSATSSYTSARFTNYVTGKVTNTVPKANVVIPEGTHDPLLGGLTYVQFARQGLALQKSQIGQNVRLAPAGRSDTNYHRYGSHLPNQSDGDDTALESGFFDGIDISLASIGSLAPAAPAPILAFLQYMDAKIADAQSVFDPTNPELIAPQLREALNFLDHTIDGAQTSSLPPDQKYNLLHELRIKRVQLNDALVLAHGLSLTASLSDDVPDKDVLTTQSSIRVKTSLTSTAANSLQLSSIELSAPGGLGTAAPLVPSPLPVGHAVVSDILLNPPHSLPTTQPYFSRHDIEQPYYDVSNPALRNAPATPAPLTAIATVLDGTVPLTLAATVSSDLSRQAAMPAVIVPRLSIAISPTVRVFPAEQAGKTPVTINVDVKTNVANLEPRLELEMPKEWKTIGPQDDFILPNVHDSHTVRISVIPAGIVPGSMPSIKAHALEPKLGDKVGTNIGYRPVGYPGLVSTNYYTPATLRVVPVDVHTAPALNVAYLPGTGDDVPAALDQLGIHTHILAIADLTAETLKSYDTVILGVRAYTAHPELAGPGSQPLIDYARAGGTVIVQYNNARYGDAEAPFSISVAASSGDHAHDVVDEAQPVVILTPDAPLLTWPNRITAADFNGWIEERGHSFAGTWAPEYQAMLETHDPDQPPQQGGLLAARVGKGSYIYLGLALYRQLPEGVPGAYRLFANLISAAKNPAFQSAPAR